jgi:N,N'-diacetyllegionaminate synthase
MKRPSISEFERQGKVFVVAEVAQAHDGSLGILHSFIDACAGAKVDAVKFQIHEAEAESSAQEPFRTRFSYVDATRFDYWKRMGFAESEWAGVKDHCDKAGVEFLATPFSNIAVDLLERLGVNRYKIGSGDVTNALMVERIARTGKEAILSTGLSTLDEVKHAVERLRKGGATVLQCTTRYPTEPEDVGLAAVPELKHLLNCPTGLSDHSGTIYPGIAAVALGASVVEAHITFDRRMFGPDAKASLTVDEFADLVTGIRFMERARGGSAKKILTPDLDNLRATFGRSIAVNSDLPAGHVLAIEDLEGKKPAGEGLSAGAFQSVIGRRLARAMAKWDFLRESDLA